MQREIPSPMNPSAIRVGSPAWLRPAGILVAASILLALCARLSFPLTFSPVPLSLQPFGVLLLGLLLSPRASVAAVGAYLVEGACGLPVFAPTVAGTAGLAHLLGPTGGYLFAYPVAAGLISFLWRRAGRGFSMALAAAALGDLLILASGALWLAASTHIAATSAASASFLAFLPGDGLKIVAAAGIATGLQRLRLRTGR
ncbi:MAG: biotin transporter BioY [Terracidiphilus sp.]